MGIRNNKCHKVFTTYFQLLIRIRIFKKMGSIFFQFNSGYPADDLILIAFVFILPLSARKTTSLQLFMLCWCPAAMVLVISILFTCSFDTYAFPDTYSWAKNVSMITVNYSFNPAKESSLIFTRLESWAMLSAVSHASLRLFRQFSCDLDVFGV